ncbi:unnamed protein product [Mytilus coruscus]|uniref:Uncharacterized protein n=1 Tax=Mytilus coruscus TaxID=42192 RepID=A0A6J8DQ49_MYTCO|nr:unnamed protein product [Mytilus coruscus]
MLQKYKVDQSEKDRALAFLTNPYNSQKACHRRYFYSSFKPRSKSCRIDFTEEFEIDGPDLLRTPSHISPLTLPDPEAIQTAFALQERPDTLYQTVTSFIKYYMLKTILGSHDKYNEEETKMISILQPHKLLIIIRTYFVIVAAQTNLAIYGTADQQSTLVDSLGIHSANLAIEGPANNYWEDGCSSTKPNQAYAWWGLTLPQVAFITNVVIYYRGDSKYSL